VERTAAAGAAEQAGALQQAFARAGRSQADCAGLSATSVGEIAVASSTGMRRYARTTSALLKIIAERRGDPATSGFASGLNRDLGAVDAVTIAERAAQKAALGAGAVDLEPGEYDVVLEPAAVS